MIRTLALLLAISGCKNPTKGLGDDPADDAVIADQPVLAHLADAMGDPDATVLDLFEKEVGFASAPDPSDLFVVQHDAHAALPEGTGLNLSVLTFNAGLLSRRYLVFKVEVPHIDERREAVADALFSAGHDILFLQEVWEVDDAEMLAEAGEAAGYQVVIGAKNKFQKETGLVIAVRDELIGGADLQEGQQYQAQWKSENFPGPNLKRGFLHWSFPLADTDVELHLFDTHLTPFYTEARTRSLQARELGLTIAELPAEDLVLVGGDFNAGWHYPDDVWTDSDGEAHPGWWRNASMAPLLAYYGELEDAVNLAEVARDVEAGAEIPTNPDASWADTPFGDASLCEGADTFTATDCNSLYRQSYFATEFPARMDLLWLRDLDGRVRVRSREMAFHEPLDFGGESFELSDHFGQSVEIEVLD